MWGEGGGGDFGIIEGSVAQNINNIKLIFLGKEREAGKRNSEEKLKRLRLDK